MALEELRAELAADGSAFGLLYYLTTVEVAAAIDRGEFNDGWYMEHYAYVFAKYYLREPRMAVWRIRPRSGSDTLQGILLGMNAHISGDLPFALAEIKIEAKHYRDHLKVTEILARSDEVVLSHLEKRYGEVTNAPSWIVDTIISYARVRAYQHGRRLQTSRLPWAWSAWIQARAIALALLIRVAVRD